MPVLTAFAAADSGTWRIERIDAARGEPMLGADVGAGGAARCMREVTELMAPALVATRIG